MSPASAPSSLAAVPTVLVIDDSAVVRQFMLQLAERRRDLCVITAADPMIAESKLRQIRPDVILLDLEMPRMTGLEFLRRQMRRDPLPVVVCSSYAPAGSEQAIAALAEGAVEILLKPKLGVRQYLDESAQEIVDVLRCAATVRLDRPAPARALVPALQPRAARSLDSWGEAIVGLGASTGGPQAIDQLLSALPAPFPPIVVVQHMPRAFTGAFARRLDSRSALDVREASDGEVLAAGMARIAPGGQHLRVERESGAYVTRLVSAPPVDRHRPSVDVLFRSLVTAAGSRAAAVLLTGMGRDGAQGLLELRRAGARTLAESEASAVVFGMPREALQLGAAEDALELEAIPAWLCRWAEKGAAVPVSAR